VRIWRHWAEVTARVTRPTGQVWKLSAWGGSGTSIEDAKGQARHVLASIARRTEAGDDLERYPYSDRPLREEILHEMESRGGSPRAVITRNSYGSLVLNTQEAMFIDVGLPDAPLGGLGRAVAGLFGRKRGPEDPPGLARIRSVATGWPDMRLRVYRTCKGLRLLVTNATFEPKETQANDILTAFGSDPLYIRLCSAQECLRARLPPKHWRIVIPRPPAR